MTLIEALDVLLQVLADFPHTTAELKVDYLLDLFPEIQPRSFSIASSLQVSQAFVPTICMMSLLFSSQILIARLQWNIFSAQTHQHRLQILVAVVRYKTKLFKPRRGLCSTWLASLDPIQGPSTNLSSYGPELFTLYFRFLKSAVGKLWGSNGVAWTVSGEIYVPLWVKKGTLKFPKDKDTPVIMVGPGTGVAPFRSALQERLAEGKHSTQWFVSYSDLRPSLRFNVSNLLSVSATQQMSCSLAVALSPKTSTSARNGRRRKRWDT